MALERWRQEAREHEKQLFGMFCHAMAQCNAALTTMLRLVKTKTERRRGSSGNDVTLKLKLKDEEGRPEMTSAFEKLSG